MQVKDAVPICAFCILHSAFRIAAACSTGAANGVYQRKDIGGNGERIDREGVSPSCPTVAKLKTYHHVRYCLRIAEVGLRSTDEYYLKSSHCVNLTQPIIIPVESPRSKPSWKSVTEYVSARSWQRCNRSYEKPFRGIMEAFVSS